MGGAVTVLVGIVDIGIYVPERFMTAAEIAGASGIPEDIVRTRFGLEGKHVSSTDEHVSDMCVAAARALVDRHRAEGIDAIAYFGSHWKDYLVWNAAPKIQHGLGLGGYAFELINVSAGAPVALKIVTDMLRADPDLGSLLLVGASKESHLLDYTNERARFMFNFGDGAVAVLLRRGHDENVVLGSSLLTDGSFSEQVSVPGGGSVNPPSHATIDARLHFLDVADPGDMKARLDPITMPNFVRVARDACARSGCDLRDISLLLPIHMKRSIHSALLDEFGLDEKQALYLDHHGHMSAVDPFFALALARERGMLSDGMLVMLLAAGTGYTWAASVIRWGRA